MTNLLNFNVTRDLGFSHVRELQFDVNRDLGFDPNRDLTFHPNRDLGFGKRGVLFRGYVCANCGAIVSPEARECDECGAVFEEPERRGTAAARAAPRATPSMRPAPAPRPAPAAAPPLPPPPAYAPPPAPVYRPPAAPTLAPAPPGPAASRFCPNCGARSWSGDAFCWNCGARFTASSGVVTASPGSPPAAREGAETLQLPARKAKKVVKDWRETGKDLSEYAEEK